MVVPLLWPALLWVIGIAWAVVLPGIAWEWWLLPALLVTLLWLRLRWTPLLLLLAGLLWGGAAQTWLVWQQQVDGSWVGQRVQLEAVVTRVQQTSFRQRLTLHGVRRSDGVKLHGDIWCYLYGKQQLHGVMAGDHLRATLKLYRPHSRHNPGGFDFRRYCRDHHIVLLGSPHGKPVIQSDPTLLSTVRQRVHDALFLLDPLPRAVLSALLLADRAQLSDAQWQLFSASGTAHLLAISGLHVGMVAGWGFMLLWWLLTRREGWIIRFPVRRCALVAGVVLAVAYATLAGWSLPTQRAVLMLAAVALAWWLRSRAHPFNTMLAALMVMLLVDPLAITSVSLWLSFVAVMALVLWGMQESKRQQHPRYSWLYGLLWVSAIAALATLPLVAGVFGRFPLYALPANLLMVPLYGAWVLPASLSAALLAIIGWQQGAHVLLLIAGTGVEAGAWLLQQFYHLPGGSWWLPHLPWWWLVLVFGMLCGAAVLWWRKQRGVALAGVCCALLMLVVWPESDVAQTEWAVWDVGQGAATTIRFPGGKVMAIDAPGSRGSRFNGGNTVADGLRSQGVTRLTVVAVSHLQSDHAGGISSLLRRMNSVEALWLADVPENRHSRQVQRWQQELRRLGGSVHWLAQGDAMMVGGHGVRVLWPPRGMQSSNANNLSLVLSVDLGGATKLLAMGDSEAPVERRLAKQGIGHHALLLVPHHGSLSSSTPKFVRQVHPVLAIMQTGWHNRFHFPHRQVVQRYRQSGAVVINTAAGAVMGRVDGRGRLSVVEWN